MKANRYTIVSTLVLFLACANAFAGGWFHSGRRSAAGGMSGALREATSWSNAYSVNFDGTNDYVTIGQPTDMDGASPWPLSICAWYRQNDLGEQHYVVSRARPFTPVMTFVMATNTDGTAFAYLGNVADTTAGGALGSLIWRNICVTASTSGTTGKLYVDGAQVGSNMTSLGTDDATVDWLIGATRNAATNDDAALFSDGNIDEVTFWNTELSATDVLNVYNGGLPANPATHAKAANLIHYYPMGDGDTHPTLLDLVGTADGTMVDMASNDIEALVPELWTPLTCTGTCDMSLVADDAGATWVDRTATFTATRTGTPTKTASTTFKGASYLTAFSSSAYYLLPANAAHNPALSGDGSAVTWEFVLANLPNPSQITWAGNIYNGNDGGWWFFTNTVGRLDISLANLAAGAYIGGVTANSAFTADRPILITVTYDFAAPAAHLYINGAEYTGNVWPDTTVSGTFNSESCAFGIGARWSCNTSATSGGIDAATQILQIVRHRSVLSSGTITTRAAQFNRLKGY